MLDHGSRARLQPRRAFVRTVPVGVVLGIGQQHAKLGISAMGVGLVLKDTAVLTVPSEARWEFRDVDEFHNNHFTKSTFAISAMRTNDQGLSALDATRRKSLTLVLAK
jgi:hypothetical protein